MLKYVGIASILAKSSINLILGNNEARVYKIAFFRSHPYPIYRFVNDKNPTIKKIIEL